MITYYFLEFNEAIQDIQSMPQFFADAIEWGQEASFYALGFLTITSLAVNFFKR